MQCRATSKRTKKSCRKQAIKGGTVCRMHGGGAPQVEKKARERLNDLVDPAINKLAEALEHGKLSPQAITAARDILDRTGYKPGVDLKVTGGPRVYDPGREILPDDDLKKLIALAEKLKGAEGDQE